MKRKSGMTMLLMICFLVAWSSVAVAQDAANSKPIVVADLFETKINEGVDVEEVQALLAAIQSFVLAMDNHPSVEYILLIDAQGAIELTIKREVSGESWEP